jgi:hypothetical protein
MQELPHKRMHKTAPVVMEWDKMAFGDLILSVLEYYGGIFLLLISLVLIGQRVMICLHL